MRLAHANNQAENIWKTLRKATIWVQMHIQIECKLDIGQF